MKRFLRTTALGLALSAGGLVASCSATRDHGATGEKEENGTFRALLQTSSASGKVYRLRQAFFDITGNTDTASVNKTLSSDTDPTSPVVEAFLPVGFYELRLRDGWFIEQVDGLTGNSAIVGAALINSSFQTFQIRSDIETLVNFTFLVDGSRVTFGPPGRAIVGIGVTEGQGEGGVPPPPPAFDRRALMENNSDAMAGFTMQQVFEATQSNANLAVDGLLLYHEMIDSYATAANGRLPTAIHCGDEMTNGVPTLNGYPIRCDRAERFQFDNIDRWFPTAVVNRLDLAPADGSNCGQQRVIFANNAQNRMFTIFEAQIPNPHPECGIDACRPIAEFWGGLRDIADAKERGLRLLAAFMTGVPELAAAGFRPFLSLPNLSVGTGNVRTNNFDEGIWTLRQFKLMSDPEGQSRVVPFPVSEAPHGDLWNDTSTLPAGAQCRSSFLSAVSQLLSSDPAEMGFVVDSECLDSESENNFSEDYASSMDNGSGAFRNQLADRLVGTGLSPEDIATRARFAGSCIGCHEEATGSNLGNGVSAPFSNGFVHVDEFSTEDCGDGTTCFRISPALRDVFLPRRQRALTDLLNRPSFCGSTAVDAGSGPGPGPGSTGDGGVPVVTFPDAGAPPPSSVITPDESTKDLVTEDQTARDKLQGDTLGGQPAGTNH
jgi:hypothetical protein